MGRHGAIRADLHQFAKQGLRVLLDLDAMAFLCGLGRPLLGRRRRGQRFGQAAAESLEAFAAAGIETHGSGVSCSRGWNGCRGR